MIFFVYLSISFWQNWIQVLYRLDRHFSLWISVGGRNEVSTQLAIFFLIVVIIVMQLKLDSTYLRVIGGMSLVWLLIISRGQKVWYYIDLILSVLAGCAFLILAPQFLRSQVKTTKISSLSLNTSIFIFYFHLHLRLTFLLDWKKCPIQLELIYIAFFSLFFFR